MLSQSLLIVHSPRRVKWVFKRTFYFFALVSIAIAVRPLSLIFAHILPVFSHRLVNFHRYVSNGTNKDKNRHRVAPVLVDEVNGVMERIAVEIGLHFPQRRERVTLWILKLLHVRVGIKPTRPEQIRVFREPPTDARIILPSPKLTQLRLDVVEAPRKSKRLKSSFMNLKFLRN